MAGKGTKILEVTPGSAAETMGLRAGDRILTVNGHEVPDELALRFHLSAEYADLHILHPSGVRRHFEVNLPEGADLGIRVEEFPTKTCNNACLFCFIDQLPPCIRPGLRMKDDDYRLSFLHGNYITLTNLTNRDLDRIIEHRLSPLYVSVHTTDPELRKHILGRQRLDDLNAKLRRLIRGGIRLHAQVVLIPGVNDREILEKTIFDLYGLHPGIQSIAVVPMGLSDHGKPKDRFIPMKPEYARALIRDSEGWRDLFRRQIGRTFAYLADEFYLLGGSEIPEGIYYDDFAQIEDGVGMVRAFLDDFEKVLRSRRKRRANLKGTLTTGGLFFPILRDCIEKVNLKLGSDLQVCKIENRFLGRNITVAGLLGGGDILTALSGRDLGDFLIIPGEALSQDGVMIDDLSAEDLSRNLAVPVYPGGRTVRDFFRLLSRISGD